MAFQNCCFSLILLLLLLLSLFHFQLSNAAVKGGYFLPVGNEGEITAADIDSTLFTHLLCAFAIIDNQTNQVTPPPQCSSFPSIVKQKNRNVQALLSIGGGDAEPTNAFKAMARNRTSRKTFIDSSIDLAVKNGFNGLDLDWEQQDSPEEMKNLAALLTEWRAAIQAQSKTEPLLLTAALKYRATSDSGFAFPAKAIIDNLDWVNVMAYDLYAPAYVQKPYVTRPPASLRGSDMSGSSGISSWISAGVPANKLVLGIPFYGYAWILSDANNNGLLAPASGADTAYGQGGDATQKHKAHRSRSHFRRPKDPPENIDRDETIQPQLEMLRD